MNVLRAVLRFASGAHSGRRRCRTIRSFTTLTAAATSIVVGALQLAGSDADQIARPELLRSAMRPRIIEVRDAAVVPPPTGRESLLWWFDGDVKLEPSAIRGLGVTRATEVVHIADRDWLKSFLADGAGRPTEYVVKRDAIRLGESKRMCTKP